MHEVNEERDLRKRNKESGKEDGGPTDMGSDVVGEKVYMEVMNFKHPGTKKPTGKALVEAQGPTGKAQMVINGPPCGDSTEKDDTGMDLLVSVEEPGYEVAISSNKNSSEHTRKTGKRKGSSVRTWKRQARSICMEGIETGSDVSLRRLRNESKEEGDELEEGLTKKGRTEMDGVVGTNVILAEAAERPRQQP